MTRDNRTIGGGGPWQFEPDTDLAPGESFVLNFREEEKGRFKKWMPFDVAQITNLDGSNAVTVTYNGIFTDTVVPNASETFSQQQVASIRLTNAGGTTISATDLKVSVKTEPYGADERAREQATQPPVAQMVERFTGLSLGKR